ncbi:cobyric acid synthase [Niallia sp. NCCP-28]|uniref:cobyric acid synthase n=1 Tax=Niallia sp. NCCP-28 TaxID=2934712 RepID=UPI00208A283A|nr:cobyric acid synthase [Niallia sp. NCCP-28]GKU84660.1 cobyric acid synthase [Niallia sp. NCCP-28]
MKGIMVVGTSSDVGKSFIATAICRILSNKGIKVSPFKSQNMSNNSYVTIDGKEIGRAQGIQAEAARTNASVWMNPILLKPCSNMEAEVVLLGKALKVLSGKKYRDQFYEQGLAVIQESLDYLKDKYDAIVMEGAGSPVEINLKSRELVNMKVAEMADVPVILVADIDRGGVFASIVGTLALLKPEERCRVKGIIINKFRGDIDLFADGIDWLEEHTKIPVLGVLPYIEDHMIDGEDSLSFHEKRITTNTNALDIAVIKLPFISNYSDMEPFYYEEDVSIRFVETGAELGNPDAVIIPGTKSTLSDLAQLQKVGLTEALKQYNQQSGTIIGICGGFQMLCTKLEDPFGADTGKKGLQMMGLNIISASTTFQPNKQTILVEGEFFPATELKGEKITGYEIHIGETTINKKEGIMPFLLLDNGKEDGCYAENGRIIGTYMHHLFHNDEFRSIWLNRLRIQKGYSIKETNFISKMKDKRFDLIAEIMKSHIDWDMLEKIIFQGADK